MPIYGESAAQNVRDKLLQLLQGARSTSEEFVPKTPMKDLTLQAAKHLGATGPEDIFAIPSGGLVLKGSNAIRNAEKVHRVLIDTLSKTSKLGKRKLPDSGDIAVAYLKAKYPKLTGKLKQFDSWDYVPSEYDPYSGIFDELNSKISLFSKQGTKTIPEMVETGGHELAHFWHSLRDRLILDAEVPWLDASEDLADRAGETARRTYQIFRNLMK